MKAGEVRSAGSDHFGAGNVTFVKVYDAGYVDLSTEGHVLKQAPDI